MGKPLSRPDCLRRNNPTCLRKNEEDDMYIEDCYIPQRSIYDTMRINEQIDLGAKANPPSRCFVDHTHSQTQRAVDSSTLSSNGTPTTSNVFETRFSSESKKLDERLIFDALKLSSDVIRSSGPPKRRPHVERKENTNRRSWKAFLPPNFPDFTERTEVSANEPTGSSNSIKEKRLSSHLLAESPDLSSEKELIVAKSTIENEHKSARTLVFQQRAESKLKTPAVLSQSSESESAPLMECKHVLEMARFLPEHHTSISATWPRAFKAQGTLEDASFLHKRTIDLAQESIVTYAASLECRGVLDSGATRLDVQEVTAEFDEQNYEEACKCHINPEMVHRCETEEMLFMSEFLSEELALQQLDAVILEGREEDTDSLLQFEQEEQRLTEEKDNLIEDSVPQQLDRLIIKQVDDTVTPIFEKEKMIDDEEPGKKQFHRYTAIEVVQGDTESLIQFKDERNPMDNERYISEESFQLDDVALGEAEGDTDSLIQFEEMEQSLIEDAELYDELAFQQLDAVILENTEVFHFAMQLEEDGRLIEDEKFLDEKSALQQLDAIILENTERDAVSPTHFYEEQRQTEDNFIFEEAARQLDAVILENTKGDADSLLQFEDEERKMIADSKDLFEESAFQQLDAVILASTEGGAHSLRFEQDEKRVMGTAKIMESDVLIEGEKEFITLQTLSSLVSRSSEEEKIFEELENKQHRLRRVIATEQRSTTSTEWKYYADQKEISECIFLQGSDTDPDANVNQELTNVSEEDYNLQIDHDASEVMIDANEVFIDENSNKDEETAFVVEVTGSDCETLFDGCGMQSTGVKCEGQLNSLHNEECEPIALCPPANPCTPTDSDLAHYAQEVVMLSAVEENPDMPTDFVHLNEHQLITEIPSTDSIEASYLDLSHCAQQMATLHCVEETRDMQAALVQLEECEMVAEPPTTSCPFHPLAPSVDFTNCSQEVIISNVIDADCDADKLPGNSDEEEHDFNLESKSLEFEECEVNVQSEFSDLVEPDAAEMHSLQRDNFTDFQWDKQKGLIELDAIICLDITDPVALDPVDTDTTETPCNSDNSKINSTPDALVQHGISEVLLIDEDTDEQVLKAIRFLFQSDEDEDTINTTMERQANKAQSWETSLQSDVLENVSTSYLDDDFIEEGTLESLFEMQEASFESSPWGLSLDPGPLCELVETGGDCFAVKANQLDSSAQSDTDDEVFIFLSDA